MRDNYNHFIEDALSNIVALTDRLHSLYEQKNHLYNTISKNKDYLKFIGFPYVDIERIQYDKVSIIKTVESDYFEDTKEHMILMGNIRAFYTISAIHIPNAINKIKFYNTCATMPFKAYSIFMKELNHNISKQLLIGNKYSFPNKIGVVKIQRIERNFKRKVIDFGETNKVRKAGGKEVIYHIDDEYLAPVYNKTNSTCKNYKLYRFKFNSFIHTPERQQLKFYESVKSIDEVVNSNLVGNLEKMLAIKQLEGIKYYPKVKEL